MKINKENNLDIRTALSYDDVSIVPKYSEIISRRNIDTTTRFSKRVFIKNPIVSANMMAVTGSEMASAMARYGGLGILHRFQSIEEEAEEVRKVKNSKPEQESSMDKDGGLLVGASVGLKDGVERADALIKAGADVIVIDIAHGHYKRCIELIKQLKEKFSDTDIVAGNVVTKEGVEALIEAGVDAVKVGIGPGSACSTRIVAGAGVPQFTAILDCASIANEHDVPIIADGGIKNSGDIAKAIGAGASSVMIGNLFAGCSESPGDKFTEDGKVYKMYMGSASKEVSLQRFQKEGDIELRDRAPEGVAFKILYKGDVKKIIENLRDGFQSGMSYAGANNIQEFWEKADFVRITEFGYKESLPREWQI